jgi:hypothetical protein
MRFNLTASTTIDYHRYFQYLLTSKYNATGSSTTLADADNWVGLSVPPSQQGIVWNYRFLIWAMLNEWISDDRIAIPRRPAIQLEISNSSRPFITIQPPKSDYYRWSHSSTSLSQSFPQWLFDRLPSQDFPLEICNDEKVLPLALNAWLYCLIQTASSFLTPKNPISFAPSQLGLHQQPLYCKVGNQREPQ